jgi:hypothetical protein
MEIVWAVLLGLGLGCAPTPGADAELYPQALAVSQPVDLSPCAAISAEDLRGDCQLVLATRMTHPAQWCAQVDAQPWQGECWFVAAEGARDAGQWDDAIAHCQRAGPFLASCNQHLWQAQLHAILRPHQGADFTATLAEVTRLHRQWHPHLGNQMNTPFWTTYVRTVLQGAPSLSPLWCNQLPDGRRALCFRTQQLMRQQAHGAPSLPPADP